jgi:hypothetical protein
LGSSSFSGVVVLGHVTAAASPSSVHLAFEGWCFKVNWVSIGHGVTDIAWPVYQYMHINVVKNWTDLHHRDREIDWLDAKRSCLVGPSQPELLVLLPFRKLVVNM